MGIQLTNDQTKARDMLIEFFKDKLAKFAVIIGSAGVGKTFMMQLLPTLHDAQRVVCTAPTNKAVRVLGQVMPDEMVCVTIHKFLGLGVKNVKDQKKSYRMGTYDPTEWAHIRVVVVDESSMLDEGLCAFIEEDAKEWNRKYIFVGDDCQLPPVEGDQKQTKSFGMASKPEYRVELTEIVRQAADNPIIQAATEVRDAIKQNREPKIIGGINEQEGTGVVLLRRKKWLEKLAEFAGDPRIHTDVDFCRTIAWTNEAVKDHNQYIRHELGVDISRPFDLGDTVIVNEAIEKGFVIVIGTGEEVIIETMEPCVHPVREFKQWRVTLEGLDLSEPLMVLDEESRPAYKQELEKLRKQCILSKNWQPFYGLKNYYADLRPPYSITAHKSQGSTFQYVFLDLRDIYSNRNQGEADKCYYVGLTRAARRAYVIS